MLHFHISYRTSQTFFLLEHSSFLPSPSLADRLIRWLPWLMRMVAWLPPLIIAFEQLKPYFALETLFI